MAERLAQLKYTRWERDQASIRTREVLAEVERLRAALLAVAENNHSFHAVNGNGDRIRLVECEVEACATAREAMGNG